MIRRLHLIFTVMLCLTILLIPQTAVLYDNEVVDIPDGATDEATIDSSHTIDSISATSLTTMSSSSHQSESEISSWRVTSAPANMSIPEGEIDYVIITPAGWRDALDTLVELRSKSFKTVVYNIENITQYYDGRDDAEKLRNFIQELYLDHDLEYVLLVGDVNHIPIRYVFNPDGANDDQYGFNETYKPTDLYYSCLKGDWDIDEDEIYGESSKYCSEGVDEIYWNFNVAVGRIPANNLDDVQHYVDKVLHYEATYGGWLNRMLLIGAISNFEFEYPEYGATDEALLSDVIYNSTIPNYMNVTKLYSSSPSYHSYSNITKQAILDQLNNGVAIVNFAGHGTVSSLLGKTDPDNDHIIDWETYFSRDDINDLTNTEAYAFYYTFACLVAAIDAREQGGYSHDSLGEELLLKEDGGAVGLVGSTRRSWYEINIIDSTDRLHNYLFWKMFFEERYYRIGECLLRTKDAYFDEVHDISDESDRKQLFTYILLGDPALDLWTDQPESINTQLLGNVSTVYSGQRITVNVTDNNGTPISYARVGVINENDSAYGYADEGGIAHVYTPQIHGTYDVYAKGHDTLFSMTHISLEDDSQSPTVLQHKHTRSYTDEVVISIRVTDQGAGVKTVKLVYHVNDSIHESVDMIQDQDELDLYTYTLGSFCCNTNISYTIYITDGAGNSKKLSEEYALIDDIAPEIFDLYFGLKRYDADTPFEYYIYDLDGGEPFNYSSLYYTTFLPNETINIKNCNWTHAVNITNIADKVVGTIPKQPFNTTVYYRIVASDTRNQKTLIGHYLIGDLFAPRRSHERVTVFGNSIKFSIEVTEPCNASGVKKVILYYSTDRKNWNSSILEKDSQSDLYTVVIDRSQTAFSSHVVLYWAIRAEDHAGKINDFPQKPNILFIHLSNIEGFLLIILCIGAMLYISRSLQIIEFLPRANEFIAIISIIHLYLLNFISINTISKTNLKYTSIFRKLKGMNTTEPQLRKGIFQIHPQIIYLIKNPIYSLVFYFSSITRSFISGVFHFIRVIGQLIYLLLLPIRHLIEICLRNGIIITLNIVAIRCIRLRKTYLSMEGMLQNIVCLFLKIFHIPSYAYKHIKATIIGMGSRLKNASTVLKTSAYILFTIGATLFSYAIIVLYHPQTVQLLTSLPTDARTIVLTIWNGVTTELKDMTSVYDPVYDIGWIPLIPRLIPLNIQLALIISGAVFFFVLIILVRQSQLFRNEWMKRLTENEKE